MENSNHAHSGFTETGKDEALNEISVVHSKLSGVLILNGPIPYDYVRNTKASN